MVPVRVTGTTEIVGDELVVAAGTLGEVVGDAIGWVTEGDGACETLCSGAWGLTAITLVSVVVGFKLASKRGSTGGSGVILKLWLC